MSHPAGGTPGDGARPRGVDAETLAGRTRADRAIRDAGDVTTTAAWTPVAAPARVAAGGGRGTPTDGGR